MTEKDTQAPGRPTGRHGARIDDVARAAGVSVPTVSRVLTGAARVSPQRRERVLQAIQDLGYRPSHAARTLVTGRSEIVAVITSETAIHGYSTTLKGIETAARAVGHHVVISVVESPAQADVRHAVDLVLGLPPAGVIVLKFDPVGVAVLAELSATVPVVAVSGEVAHDRPQAVLDETTAGEVLTRELLRLGHRTVHHVAVPSAVDEDGRTTGWRRALQEAGAPVPPILHAASFEAGAGQDLAGQVAALPGVSAVFCGNDEVAMGLIAGLARVGLEVPDDLSVAGFDDHPLARVWRPALTTVHQDFQDLGERAFALMAARLAGDTGATVSSALPELRLRASTAAPPAGRSGRTGPQPLRR